MAKNTSCKNRGSGGVYTTVQMKNCTICIFSKIGFFIWSDLQKSPLFNGKKIILIEQIEFEISLPIQQLS